MQKEVYLRHIKNERNHWWFSARKDIILSLIKNIYKEKISVLDFGSGSGTNVEMLSKFGKVDVFEIDKNTKSFLKKKFRKKKKINVIEKIKNKSYDLVLAADVLEHIKNDKTAIKKLYNSLKKNGQILITVPAFKFLYSAKDEALKHFRRYEKSELENLLKKHFKIKKISYFNFFLFFPIFISISYFKFKKKKFIKYAETTPIMPLNYLLEKIFKIEKFFLKYINFPFGISIIALAKKK